MAIRNWWKRKCPNCGGLLEQQSWAFVCPTCSAHFETNPVGRVIVAVGFFAAIFGLFSYAFDLRMLEREWEQMGGVASVVGHAVGTGIGLLAAYAAGRFVPLQPMGTRDARLTSDQAGFVGVVADTSDLTWWRNLALLVACLVIPAAYLGDRSKPIIGLAGIEALIVLIFLWTAWKVRCPCCRIRVIRPRPTVALGMTAMAACPECSYRPWLRSFEAPTITPASRGFFLILCGGALALGFWLSGRPHP